MALLKKDAVDLGKKNSALVLFWTKLSELFGEYLEDSSTAKFIEDEIAKLFPRDHENLLTFIRCLNGISLPVEGEFKELRKFYNAKNIDSNYVESTIANAAYSMQMFRKWTYYKILLDENEYSIEDVDDKKDFSRIYDGLLHGLRRANVPEEEGSQFLAGVSFPEDYRPLQVYKLECEKRRPKQHPDTSS